MFDKIAAETFFKKKFLRARAKAAVMTAGLDGMRMVRQVEEKLLVAGFVKWWFRQRLFLAFDNIKNIQIKNSISIYQ